MSEQSTKHVAIVGSGLVAAEVMRIAPDYLGAGLRASPITTDYCLDSPELVAGKFDLAILCGGRSEEVVARLDPHGRHLRLLDVSPTYRWQQDWVYGWRDGGASRETVRQAFRVANPGCVATAATLALRPVSGLLSAGPLYIDAVGGASMAGSKPGQKARVSALDGPHPHIREIETTCALDRRGVQVWLHPKIETSYERGILAAVPLVGLGADQVLDAWQKAYAGDSTLVIDTAFSGRSISGAMWAGKPGAWMTAIPERGGCLAIVCLDNLLKGAAETALRNAADMLAG